MVAVSEIQAASRVLGINKRTVINTLKKEQGLVNVNPNIQKMDIGKKTAIHVGLVCQEAELDEQWSYGMYSESAGTGRTIAAMVLPRLFHNLTQLSCPLSSPPFKK